MRTIRSVAVGAVVMVLVLVVAGAGTAQDEQTTDTSAFVSGVADYGTDLVAYITTESGVPPLDFAVYDSGVAYELDMDDPRLSGALETNRNIQYYDSGVAVGTGIGRLTNAGGSWDVAVHNLYEPVMVRMDVLYLTGVDAYEGLHAMLLWRQGGPGFEVEGLIVPGPWPEPPESLLPPTD